ncbi:3-hydroxyacyl-[acyl-carrier-protein] dehydratase FabZ [Saezia sanguinis]|uniref:3-hydroxyacyl-[acyl-carrier-protein] dehydratase FabZ n=1 Tax=Saezia sanguinis TaxID=1965230 RepID=A0A433SH05_9BURK|nr:3-hydroxyacyl-ACP dehydratase FabZ [Saezia sanguinis]RUS68008.1 3-hydroxyacyl-[acyl-carrier-protein] dehydratase FabZ [Saezia sanguinis]
MTSPVVMDIQHILSKLPHRYPFLLVDRVLELEPGKQIRALKNITINEPCFTGHFPEKPVMPGVLILEALAQASALLAFKTFDIADTAQMLFYFTSIDGARFRRPVIPGDQLILEVTFEKAKARMFRSSGRALVDGELAVEATLMCAMRGSINDPNS